MLTSLMLMLALHPHIHEHLNSSRLDWGLQFAKLRLTNLMLKSLFSVNLGLDPAYRTLNFPEYPVKSGAHIVRSFWVSYNLWVTFVMNLEQLYGSSCGKHSHSTLLTTVHDVPFKLGEWHLPVGTTTLMSPYLLLSLTCWLLWVLFHKNKAKTQSPVCCSLSVVEKKHWFVMGHSNINAIYSKLPL
jgi:hypothetical protein